MKLADAGIGRGLRAALATGDLRRLQLGSAASSIGGWAFMVALSVYAYGEGGAAAVGLAALVRMLPAGLAAPFVGLVADRRSRRDVLVVSCAGRAAAMAAIGGAVAADAPFALVLALATLVTVLQTAQRPAQAALLPLLAPTPRELAAANAAWSGLDNAGFLVGALLGGVLIASAGTMIVFSAMAAVFAVAALVLARIDRDPVPVYRVGANDVREFVGGVGAVRDDPALSLVVGVVAATTFVEGIVDVLVVVSALTVLGLGEAGAGWLNAAWGAGGLAGGAIALVLLHRRRLAGGLAGGALLAGLALLALAALPAPAAAILLLVVFGIGYALVDVAELTLVQRLASDRQLARAFGVTETLHWITTASGAAVAPLLIAWLGVRGALAVAGGCLLAVVAVRAHALARLEDGHATPERAFALLRGVAFLAPLPLGRLENLALRLEPLAADAGAAVVREGDPGGRWYVVDAGAFDVHADGRRLRRLGPGDCFGEIALLRGVPRTATVTATAPGSLYALGREEFLSTVLGMPCAQREADRFAEQRLGHGAHLIPRAP